MVGLGGQVLDVVEHECLGRVLDQVEDVVHPRDQLVDAVAVQRRDEGLVQQLDRIVGDAVRVLLLAVDRLDAVLAGFQVRVVGHQRGQAAAAGGHMRGVLVEELEEPALAGHQTSEHGGMCRETVEAGEG